MVVFGIKCQRTAVLDAKPDYYKSGNCEFTSIISYAKFFQARSSAENKMYVLQQGYKNCPDLVFSIAEIEIKEL